MRSACPIIINTLCSYCQALITEPDISVISFEVSNIFAIVGDEIPIPVKRRFTYPFQRSLPFVVFIDINHSVAFFISLFRQKPGQCSPTVCSQLSQHHLQQRLFHFPNMGSKVLNAIVIVHRAVSLSLVNRTQSIFDNKQRQLEMIPEPVE